MPERFINCRRCLRPDVTSGLIGVLLVVQATWALAFSSGPQASLIAGKTIHEKVAQYRAAHEKQILDEFRQLLSLPNLASDVPNIDKNAHAIADLLKSHGVESRLLEVEGAPPVVLGELRTPGAKSDLMFYAHYDGQPVDRTQWKGDPWAPILRDKPLEAGGQVLDWSSLPDHFSPDWRLYARSASDDKAPIICMIAALDALRTSGVPLSVNLKFFFEGEEEAGSPHLKAFLDKYGSQLKTDAWLLCDGPVHQTNRMQVFFGARGTTDLELTVYGPNRGLHSGHYGNWAPNPIMALTHLLDSIRDENSKILIDGFYDDVRPLTAAEKRAVAGMPPVEDRLKTELGLAWTEGEGATLEEQILKPAINIRGIQAGHVGSQAANVISTEANASIDFRLVPDQTLERVRKLVERHIQKMGFYIVRETPDAATRQSHAKIIKLVWGAGYPAARTPMDSSLSRAVVSAIEDVLGSPIVKCPGLGGSIPMYLFQEQGRVPVIGVPIVNYDNNQHSSNENVRIGNLWDGIEVFAGLFALIAQTN
jgi:acetylornithine deacetylase/succinyl-diaminopimelate desuccinylase-like protein